MIKEDFVSFEIAKLLKEKGFNVPVWTRYEDNDEVIFGDKYNWNNSPIGQISAPTHQMAMKWLREVHNIFIVIDRHYFVVDKISHIASGFKYSIEIKTINTVYTYNDYKSYEQAVETALKYTLENLI